MSAMILEWKFVTVSIVFPSISHEVMGHDAMILIFWMLSFKPAFSLSSFYPQQESVSSLLSAIRVVSSAYLRLDISTGSLNSNLWFIQPSILHDVLCM